VFQQDQGVQVSTEQFPGTFVHGIPGFDGLGHLVDHLGHGGEIPGQVEKLHHGDQRQHRLAEQVQACLKIVFIHPVSPVICL